MTCKHHFLVETPNGPTSEGVCTKCQEVQYFRNGFEERKKKRNGKLVSDISVNRESQLQYTQGGYFNNAD